MRSEWLVQDMPLSTGGAVVIGTIGAAAVGITALSVPFIAPALRRHALPYVPATDEQLSNLLEVDFVR